MQVPHSRRPRRQAPLPQMTEIALVQGAAPLTRPDESPEPSAAVTLHQRPLAYVDRLDRRVLAQIDLLVIHATELPTAAMARDYGEMIQYESSRTGNSGHFYIDRDGRIEQYVPLDRVANHVRGFNGRSIGVELINSGRYPHWYRLDHQNKREDYPAVQINALLDLVNHLTAHIRSLTWAAGHDELDISEIPAEDSATALIRRKMDPGDHFPWSALVNQTKLKRLLLGI